MSDTERPGWNAAWTSALDELELEVDSVEAMLRSAEGMPLGSTVDPRWQAPDLGPLPGDLRERAHQLLERQLAAAEALTRAMLGNRQQSALLDRIEDGRDGAARPAYLDRSF